MKKLIQSLQRLFSVNDNPPVSRTSKFTKLQDEPLFVAIPSHDPEFQEAYAQAAATISVFIDLIQRENTPRDRSAKLRFRNPDESERLGEDSVLYLWLSQVHYHPVEALLSGTFLEVPP